MLVAGRAKRTKRFWVVLSLFSLLALFIATRH